SLERKERYQNQQEDEDRKNIHSDKIGQITQKINEVRNKYSPQIGPSKKKNRSPTSPSFSNIWRKTNDDLEEIKKIQNKDDSKELITDLERLMEEIADIETKHLKLTRMDRKDVHKNWKLIQEIPTLPEDVRDYPGIEREKLWNAIQWVERQNEITQEFVKREVRRK